MASAAAAAAAAAAHSSTQADDVAVILFENTELRVWEQRLPPNSSGTVPVEPTSPSTWQVDVHGQREGAVPLAELAALEDHAFPGNFSNPKQFGDLYRMPGAEPGQQRETVNAGPGELRTILLEFKAPTPRL